MGANIVDHYTFSLQDVVDIVIPTTDNLIDCFSDAKPIGFDSKYDGKHDRLKNFRNYHDFDGYTAYVGQVANECNSLHGAGIYTYACKGTDGIHSYEILTTGTAKFNYKYTKSGFTVSATAFEQSSFTAGVNVVKDSSVQPVAVPMAFIGSIFTKYVVDIFNAPNA